MWGMKYDAGATYKFTAKATSSIDRVIGVELKDKYNDKAIYVNDIVVLEKDTAKDIELCLKIPEGASVADDYSANFQIRFGANGEVKYLDAHTIKFSHICLEKVQ